MPSKRAEGQNLLFPNSSRLLLVVSIAWQVSTWEKHLSCISDNLIATQFWLAYLNTFKSSYILSLKDGTELTSWRAPLHTPAASSRTFHTCLRQPTHRTHWHLHGRGNQANPTAAYPDDATLSLTPTPNIPKLERISTYATKWREQRGERTEPLGAESFLRS